MLEHLTSMQQQDAAAAPPVAPKPPAESTDAKRWWHDEQMKVGTADALRSSAAADGVRQPRSMRSAAGIAADCCIRCIQP